MIKELFLGFLLIHSVVAKHGHLRKNRLVNPSHANPQPGPQNKWLTLTGKQPWVIASGGIPLLFPDSSFTGYAAAVSMELDLPNIVMRYCNLQLTKENLGICLPDIRLNNCTDADEKHNKLQRQRHNINGQELEGLFSIDFTIDQILHELSLKQNVNSRAAVFDGLYQILAPETVAGMEPPGIPFWLNVQNEAFWTQHKLSAVRYIEDSTKVFVPNYISSPDIGFLKAMGLSRAFDKTKTKLIFRFQTPEEVEPSTRDKYSDFMGKLALIKTFASGILVPKNYIWPVDQEGYLMPATTLVTDAHKEGLEVYAAGFASDMFSSYNYSYDPEAEYLQFIDNSQFSVDGFLTDSSASAVNAIACLAQGIAGPKKLGKGLIISHNGASIDYPGSTDLAYQKAINDGADIIDCNVQMTNDGVAFCLESADITGQTTAAMALLDRSTTIPEIQPNAGIFSFHLTWNEIQSTKPLIATPFIEASLLRNPKYKNAGKLVTLPEFLKLAKENATVGILIGIQNAAYLASKKGLDVVETVNSALKNATLDPKKQVMIQSDDTSVLSKFKELDPTYKRVLWFTKPISQASKAAVDDVKKYADAVNLLKTSVVRPDRDSAFSTVLTGVVKDFHAANISVYLSRFTTETMSMLLDFYSDPYSEIATYLQEEVDGFITDNPKTGSAFMRSPCSDVLNEELPYIFFPVTVGDYLAQAQNGIKPNASAGPPIPPLDPGEVTDPPLPPLNTTAAAANNTDFGAAPGATAGGASAAPSHSSQSRIATNVGLSMAASILLIALLASDSSTRL